MSLFPEVEHLYDPELWCFLPQILNDNTTSLEAFLPRLQSLWVGGGAFSNKKEKVTAWENIRWFFWSRSAQGRAISSVRGVTGGRYEQWDENSQAAFNRISDPIRAVSPQTTFQYL